MKLFSFYRPLPLRCMMIVVISFLIALLVGYNFAPELEDWGPKMVNFRDTLFVPVHAPLSERHPKLGKYVAHNTKVIALALCIGPVIFFYPLIRTVCLGGIIGAALWNLGSPWLWGRFLLPHSLVELPVSLYVDAVAMHGGLRWLAGGPEGRRGILKQELVANLKLLLLLMPLIVFAGLLEAYVTNR